MGVKIINVYCQLLQDHILFVQFASIGMLIISIVLCAKIVILDVYDANDLKLGTLTIFGYFNQVQMISQAIQQKGFMATIEISIERQQ